MLESQGRDNRRVLSVGLGSRPSFGSIDKHLSDPAILEPADVAGMDRIRAYLPGWDLPKVSRELLTDHFAW
jgi:predicted ATP-dependent Lon-type protease